MAGICHDLRGVLHVLSVQAHLIIISSKQPPETVIFAHSVIAAVERAGAILDECTHQGPPRVEDLGELVRTTLETLRPIAQSRKVQLLDHLSPEKIPVSLYPGDIYRILQNLVTNAVEACPTDTGKIVVTTLEVDSATLKTKSARLQVSDSGIGINEKTLERVGQFGFTTKPDGNGYGIFTVQSLVTRRGGAMKIASQPGQGTTITVDFPLSQ
jgi:signal transduction histidine kinase